MKKIPESQLVIMNAVWQHAEEYGGKMSRHEIHPYLESRNWSLITVNTLLSRLVENGFLKNEHRGKEYVYTPLIKEDDYLAFEVASMIDLVFDGSAKKLIESVWRGKELSNEDLDELKSFISELQERSK